MNPERETTIADLRREHSREETAKMKVAPEPKRIQCAHCNGYYPDDEICHKNLCYKCEEDLDDYRRILNERNLFLTFIKNIQEVGNRATIMGMCERILAQYKEEKP